jgi:hypothetical protein
MIDDAGEIDYQFIFYSYIIFKSPISSGTWEVLRDYYLYKQTPIYHERQYLGATRNGQ